MIFKKYIFISISLMYRIYYYCICKL